MGCECDPPLPLNHHLMCNLRKLLLTIILIKYASLDQMAKSRSQIVVARTTARPLSYLQSHSSRNILLYVIISRDIHFPVCQTRPDQTILSLLCPLRPSAKLLAIISMYAASTSIRLLSIQPNHDKAIMASPSSNIFNNSISQVDSRKCEPYYRGRPTDHCSSLQDMPVRCVRCVHPIPSLSYVSRICWPGIE